MAIKYLSELEQYDFYYRTNTSTYIDQTLLLEFCETLPRSHVYVGPLGHSRWDSEMTASFVGGSAILMSVDVAMLLVESHHSIPKDMVDDVAIGFALARQGVNAKSGPRLQLTDFEPFSPCLNYRLKDWTRDILAERRFYEVHALMNSNEARANSSLWVQDFRELARASWAVKRNPARVLRIWIQVIGTHRARVKRLRMKLQQMR